MAKGMGGGMNMQSIMKQAQAMQEKMQRMQEELGERTVDVSVGGGMVKVTMNGRNQLVDMSISPDVIDPEDPEMLQDLVISAVNQAQEKASEMMQSEMGKVTGGMNIPGLF